MRLTIVRVHAQHRYRHDAWKGEDSVRRVSTGVGRMMPRRFAFLCGDDSGCVYRVASEGAEMRVRRHASATSGAMYRGVISSLPPQALMMHLAEVTYRDGILTVAIPHRSRAHKALQALPPIPEGIMPGGMPYGVCMGPDQPNVSFCRTCMTERHARLGLLLRRTVLTLTYNV